jgi:hypothetical protein
MTRSRTIVVVALSALLAVPVWLAAVGFVASPARASSAGTVYLTTVPALAGVAFDVRGVRVVTNQDGMAVVALSDINGVASDLTLSNTAVPGGSTVHIDRIVPAPHVPHQSHLTVGLDVTSPAKIKLLQADSHIPPSHVTRVRLHSIVGQRLSVDPRQGKTLHLLSRKIHYVHGALQAQPVTWAVEGTQADPGISVTTSEPRFDPFGHRVWTVRLAPVAGTVRVLTLPRTAGVQFDVNGTSLTTGRNGIGVASVGDLNNVKTGLTLASSTAGRYQVSALRVSKLKSIVSRQRRLLAAIDVRRGVTLRFVDSHGRSVPASRIDEVGLTTGSSSVTSLIGTEIGVPALLLTRVAERVGSGWDTRSITYSLASVKINGANAVFAGRQRFAPQTSSIWTIDLSVFSMTLTVRDALFGSKIGTSTVLTRPDGSRIDATVNANAPNLLTGMVRGLYTLKIDAAVMGGSTSILVSRDDHLELRVITLLDTVIIALGGALFLPAVVMLGVTVTRRRRRAAEATTEATTDA